MMYEAFVVTLAFAAICLLADSFRTPTLKPKPGAQPARRKATFSTEAQVFIDWDRAFFGWPEDAGIPFATAETLRKTGLEADVEAEADHDRTTSAGPS